jgi:hypothetical protein
VSSGTETRQRDQRLPVRCTAEELAQLRATAQASGFSSVGELIRARCLRVTRAPRVALADRQQFARILAEAGKIGSNVNQLARVANTNGELPAASELESIWQQVNAIRSALMSALGRGD